jgi:3-oxoacyl-[acyl-carrier-protein] synthase II
VAAVSVSAPGAEGATVERAALDDVLGERHSKVIDPQDAVGDVGAAIGPFQLAAALDTPGWVLLTALDEGGTVGSGLVKVPPP